MTKKTLIKIVKLLKRHALKKREKEKTYEKLWEKFKKQGQKRSKGKKGVKTSSQNDHKGLIKKIKKSKQTVKKQDIEGINTFIWGVKKFVLL